MPNINDYLQEIKTSVYGEEVRDAIHDAIEQCYEDEKAREEQIDAVAAAQMGAIVAKGVETLDSIPDDYSALAQHFEATVFSPDISWTIGRTVGANTGGFNTPYPTGAVTNEIPVSGGDILIRNTPPKDSSDLNLIIHLVQYANGVFQSRISLDYDVPVVLASTTTSIRLNFLRAASTGVNMTETDIENYFSVSFYQKNLSYGKYRKNAEDIETHTDAIGPLVNIAETWFNVAYDPNDQIVYETQHGPYSTLRDSNNKKAIVCSQFALACLSGLPYERSRYVQNNNAFCWWGYRSDGTGTYPYDNDYMINQYWVQYLADKGLLVPYVAGHHNIKAGDLLFYGNDIEHNGGHCRICTQVNLHQVMTMESTGEQTRLIDGASVGLVAKGINLDTNPPVYYAHMPVAPTHYTTTRMLLDNSSQIGTVSSGVSSAQIKLYEFAPFLERGFYSLVIDRDECGTGVYARLAYENGVTENLLFGVNYGFGGTIRNTFYAQMPVVSLTIRVVPESDTDYSYKITRVALYRGWHE